MPEVCFVGTGDAFGSGGRRYSAILLRERGRNLLLDCGPTTLAGLRAMDIDPREIDAIALTHFHGDHVAGVPFLLLDALHGSQRTRPLEILGPPGVQERVESTSAIFCYDTEERRQYELRYRTFEQGHTLETAGFSLMPLPALHPPETHPHMLRVGAGSRCIFFTGDTGWHDALPTTVGNADLLISECTLLEEGYPYHLSAERLERERARFECENTILTHLGSAVLEHASRVRFELAHDGLVLQV